MKKVFFIIIAVAGMIFSCNKTFAQLIALSENDSLLTGYFNMNLSKDEEKEYLKSVNDYLRQYLEEIKKGDKGKYNSLLQELYFNNLSYHPFLEGMEKKDMERSKKISELSVITEALALRYKSAGGSDKSKIKSELRQKLSELFDQKEAAKKAEVESLEKRLKELKEKLSQRSGNRDKIIDERLSEILGEKKYLNWDD
ncbi:MAG: hypothetical protein V1720_19820 [bacterium]